MKKLSLLAFLILSSCTIHVDPGPTPPNPNPGPGPTPSPGTSFSIKGVKGKLDGKLKPGAKVSAEQAQAIMNLKMKAIDK